MIRFTVLRVLDNRVVSETVLKRERAALSLESSFCSTVKLFGKKQSVRTLKIRDRRLKSLTPKGALGRTLCCFGVKRIFDLRKNCKN